MKPSGESMRRRLAAAHAGNAAALGETLEGCRRYLLWIARQQLDPDLQAKAGASDLVQETLLEARRDFGQFHGTSEAELLAWLRQLLRHNLSNFYRRYRETKKRRVGREVPLDAPGTVTAIGDRLAGPADMAIEHEQEALLHEAVQQLPAEDRRVITLWYQEQKTFEDIARELGCAPNTARNKWLRALKRLQEKLQSLG